MSEYVDESHEEAADHLLLDDAAALKLQHERMGKRALDRTRAFGKLILFGEHFVVYGGVPALVGAVSAYTDCEAVVAEADGAENLAGVQITDNRPAVPMYKVQKAAEGEQAVRLVLDHFGVDYRDKFSVRLTFGGTLTCASGIGASAAQVVSLARALKHELPQNVSEDEINAAGYEGEKGYHGTPSGIDNTAATFGGLLKFHRTDGGEPVFTRLALKHPIRIVYASTGITASTTKVVSDVRAKKEADPVWFDGLLQEYLEIVKQAETALLSQEATNGGSMPTLGALMDQNHALCQKLTVSCSELDHLVAAAKQAGAVGAKMSGTGRGGLMLALTPTVELQEAVAAALTAAGAPQVWKTTLA